MLKLRPTLAVVIAATALILAHPASAQWERFGGPEGDHVIPKSKLQPWGDSGPKELWSRDLGGGYSEILVRGNRLYTMFRRGDDEVITALDAKSGETIWEHGYEAKPVEGQNLEFGSGPNTTPLILGKRMFTIGFTNKMHAVDLGSGKVIWSKDLGQEFGTPDVYFGYAVNPIEYKGSVLVHAGGDEVGLVLLDPASGEVRWKSDPVAMSYVTPRIIDVGDDVQATLITPTEVVGVSMKSGKVAWRQEFKNQWDTHCLAPWPGDGNLLYVASGGEAGAMTLRLAGPDKAEEVSRNKEVQFSHSVVQRTGDTIYGSKYPEILLAVDVPSGEILWRERGFPETNVVRVAGERALMLDGNGQLTLAELNREGVDVLSQTKLLEKPARTAPSIVGTKVFLRDQSKLIALDLGRAAGKKGP